MRRSVDVKVMRCFPKQVVMVKAPQFEQGYHVACLNKGKTHQKLQINCTWLFRWFSECRISSRRPNRKFKVPRAVLAERFMIFWIVVSNIRKLVMLHFGYDPSMQTVGQSPVHTNVIEKHAASKEQWSLNSVTDACRDRVCDKCQGAN